MAGNEMYHAIVRKAYSDASKTASEPGEDSSVDAIEQSESPDDADEQDETSLESVVSDYVSQNGGRPLTDDDAQKILDDNTPAVLQMIKDMGNESTESSDQVTDD